MRPLSHHCLKHWCQITQSTQKVICMPFTDSPSCCICDGQCGVQSWNEARCLMVLCVACALTVIDKDNPIIRGQSRYCPAAQQEEQTKKACPCLLCWLGYQTMRQFRGIFSVALMVKKIGTCRLMNISKREMTVWYTSSVTCPGPWLYLTCYLLLPLLPSQHRSHCINISEEKVMGGSCPLWERGTWKTTPRRWALKHTHTQINTNAETLSVMLPN